MRLHGKSYSAKELRKRIGNMDQVAGIRTVQLDDGIERPGRAAVITTGTGLEVVVSLDRGLDISSASHQGRAMGWRSSCGDVAPQYYEAEGIRWLRSYAGGLVATCGLTNVGAPDPDSALNGRGLHGRIGNIPGRNIKISQEWCGDDYLLCVQGSIRETSVFGENLVLNRSVYTALGEDRFWIRDVLVNEGFNVQPFMLLYHCNIGWPALDAGSRMVSPSRFVAPRDETARNGLERWNEMDGPSRNFAEKVYYHDMAADKNGEVTAAILNDGFDAGNGFGVYVKYSKKELPRFVQWKMTGEQVYVCGLEPCTCGIEGRDVDEKHGLLQALRPGETREFNLEFGAVTHPEEALMLRRAAEKTTTSFKDHYLEFVQPVRKKK